MNDSPGGRHFQARRICVFVPTLNQGGAERVMVKLANAFSAKGHLVDLVVGNLTGPYVQEVSPDVNMVDLGRGRIATCLLPLLTYLRKNRPDGLLSTLTHANILAVVAVKLARLKTRLVLREAGLPTLDNKQSLGKSPTGLLRLAKWIFPFADCVVGVSNGVKNELVEMLQIDAKVEHTVINNPVISERIYQLATQPILLEHENLFNKPVLLGVGRFVPEKGFETLISAFVQVRQSIDCHLLILGAGELESQFIAQAEANNVSDCLFMPGFINNPYPYFKKSSVFVLSSSSEGLPNAMIEALALGVPVVSTAIVNGPTEILEEGRWGQLVPIGDSNRMADAIKSTIASGPNPIPQTESWWQRFSEIGVVDAYLEKLLG